MLVAHRPFLALLSNVESQSNKESDREYQEGVERALSSATMIIHLLEEAYELGSIVRVSCPHPQKIINERLESC